MGFARAPGKAKLLFWISHSPDCLICSYCLSIFISLISEQTIAMLQGHQNGRSLTMRSSVLMMYKILFSKCLFHNPFVTFWIHINLSLIFSIQKQPTVGQNYCHHYFPQQKYFLYFLFFAGLFSLLILHICKMSHGFITGR